MGPKIGCTNKKNYQQTAIGKKDAKSKESIKLMKTIKHGKQTIEEYIHRYPQLTLSVAEGMSASDAYRSIVRRGQMPDAYPNHFSGTEEDCVFCIDTPAGAAEVLYLADRQDFERFLQCIVYRCEPVEIPASTGAMHISGIINWRKILDHREAYLQEGNTDWDEEFRRFTADAANFKDTLLIVSKGNYSALSHEDAGFSQEIWIEKSLQIRIYHELTHFVCKRRFPEGRDAVWDEITADCMGICKALGHYDPLLAQKLLGVEGEAYRQGGRLENYVTENTPAEKLCRRVKEQIRKLAEQMDANADLPFWQRLENIY